MSEANRITHVLFAIDTVRLGSPHPTWVVALTRIAGAAWLRLIHACVKEEGRGIL